MEITAYCHRLAVYTAIKDQRVLTQKIWLVMKLTTILLLAACLQISAKGLTQTLTLTFRNAPLEKVFSEIQRQTGYSFFYEDGLLKGARPVDIAVVKASITQVLDACFTNQPYTYKIVNTAISVRRKEQLADVSRPPTPETGDPVTVSGKVTDPQGNPLVGANVKVKGSNVGVVTDNLGRFTLSNIDANAVLEVSFVGHEGQVISIKNKSNLVIALSLRQSILDETIIIAYGTSSRRFTTGNIATIKSADIEKQPVQNPLLALQGRVPGIEITQLTGMNGGGVTVRIQGRNSLRASALEPLIIIDGVQYNSQLYLYNNFLENNIVQGGSPLNYINPADIESIDILKDADATAIYGSRAANGAILITTKKGKSGKTKLSINLQQGWGKVTRRVEMMNTRQYLDMRYEAFKNDGLMPSSIPNATSPNLYAPDLTIWDTTRYTNWQKELIGGIAKYTNFNASLSGGNATVQYLIGATYNRQSTVFPGDFDNKKAALNFSVSGSSANQKLKVRLSGNYMFDRNHLPGIDLTATAVLLEPNAPSIYNDNGKHNWAPNAAGNSTWTNPLAYTISSDFTNATKNLVANANLSYAILPGLDIISNFGYSDLQNDLYKPTRLEGIAPEKRPTSNRRSDFLKRGTSSWVIEPQVSYNRKFGKGKIDGILGGTWQQNSSDFIQLIGLGYSNDQLMQSLVAATTKTVFGSSFSLYRYSAYFGRLNFNWNEKYLLSLNARRDGTSRFGDHAKYHIFGSIGVGWIFSEEKYIRNNMPFLSFGKLKGSWGTTGNDQIGDYLFISTYNSTNFSIPYQNGPGLEVTKIPNPYLQWEDTRKLQSGIDLGFIKDRILLGVAYAHNTSSNQIISYVLPAITGFSSITRNFPATIRNTSWEFTLNSVIIKRKSFNWTSNLNITIPRNKLVSFPGIEQTSYGAGNDGVIIGQPLGVSKLLRYAGVDPSSGKYLVLDQADNPTLTPNFLTDRTALVSALTKLYGGLLNSISFKGVQFDFLFQFVYQNGRRDFYYYNGSTIPGRFSSGQSNQPQNILNNHWQKPGDDALIGLYTTNNNNLIMRPPTSNAGYSYDASFIRLKNASVSWQVPAEWYQEAKLQSCLLYFRGENLATITKFSGMDPETQSSTVLPPLQMWTVGAKIEF